MTTGPTGTLDELPRWSPRLRDAVGALLGFVLLSLAASWVGSVLLGADPTVVAIASLLCGWVALAGWPVFQSRRRGGSLRRDLRVQARPVDLGIGVLATVCVLLAGIAYVIVLLALGQPIPTAAAVDVAGDAQGPALYVLVLLVAVGAPVVEELHFRGLWWQALRDRGVSQGSTLAVTSVVFAAIHLELMRLPVLLAAGVALGTVRLLTGRLGASLVAHFAINSLAAAALLAGA